MRDAAIVVAIVLAGGCTVVVGLDHTYVSVEKGVAGSSAASGTAGASAASGTGGESAASGTGGAGPGGGGQGGQPQPVCGNGVKEGAEECDDGNVAPGDGCGPGCASEDPTTCPGAPIALDSTMIEISGDTTGATDKIKESAKVGACVSGTYPGEDLVYAVTPTKSGTLTATLKANYDAHYLHIRTECPGSPQKEIGCDYDSDASNADVSAVNVTAGTTYYVSPDSYENTSGSFKLTLKLMP